MSVVEVSRVSTGREAGDSHDLSREVRATWKVLVSSRTDDHLTVLSDPRLPQIADPYLGADGVISTALLCKERRARVSEESPFLWMVEVEYGTITLDPGQQNVNPLLRPAKVKWQTVRYQRPFEKDVDGKPFVNSAGVRIEQDIDDARLVLSIEKNKATYDPVKAFAYTRRGGAINSDVWLYNSAPGQFRVAQYDGEDFWEGGHYYWRHSFAFEFREEGWNLAVLDEGKAEMTFDGTDFWWDPIVSKDTGQPVSDPVPLNGYGEQLWRSKWTLTNDISAENNGPGFNLTGSASHPDPPFAVKITNEVILIVSETPPVIVRGYAGTTAAAHVAGVDVTMEPYFLTFRPYPSLPFGALGLP